MSGLTKKLLLSVLTWVLIFVTLGTSTFAWFSMNYEVVAEDFINTHEKSIINATVLYKTPELLKRCQKIIFVTAPFFTRLRRARNRDHLPYRQIFRRFHAQRNLLKEYKRIPLIKRDHAKCIAAVTFCGTIWKAVVHGMPSS